MATKGRNKIEPDPELVRRKRLTFEQAEGLQPLPTQLKPREISDELRAILWEGIYNSLMASQHNSWLLSPWLDIAYDKHVLRDHRMADTFSGHSSRIIDDLRKTFESNDYAQVLGLTQWILRHQSCPDPLRDSVQSALEAARAAYVLVDGDTIMPISSSEEVAAIQQSLEDTSTPEFEGARTHLKRAMRELSDGHWADSIRESIHAVEAAAKTIEPKANTLGPALTKLSKSHGIHEAMKAGFASLYGFTSDEKGIRHSLLDKGDANVDAADAQYMLGACASFVSYLLARARLKA